MPPASMSDSFLDALVDAVHSAVARAGAPSARCRLLLRFQAELDAGGGVRLRPAAPNDDQAQVLELELGQGTEPRVPGRASHQVSVPDPDSESVTGGDPTTLGRRLELVLGGPPGFTTGARAEVLADLLVEFGRPAILERLRNDWATQFATGPEASASVTKVPSAEARTQLPDATRGA